LSYLFTIVCLLGRDDLGLKLPRAGQDRTGDQNADALELHNFVVPRGALTMFLQHLVPAEPCQIDRIARFNEGLPVSELEFIRE
jgi:hypothetical protein